MAEYPKEMHHPGFAPAVLSDDNAAGRFGEAPPGQPVRYPPVMVSNADQEAYHASRGYVLGKTPPTPQPRPALGYQERKNIRTNTYEIPPEGETFEYPKWVGDRIAHSAEEEQAILEEASFGPRPLDPLDEPTIDPDELAEFRAWKAARGSTKNEPVQPKRKRELSEEQRQVLRARMAHAREVARRNREQNAQTHSVG